MNGYLNQPSAIGYGTTSADKMPSNSELSGICDRVRSLTGRVDNLNCAAGGLLSRLYGEGDPSTLEKATEPRPAGVFGDLHEAFNHTERYLGYLESKLERLNRLA